MNQKSKTGLNYESIFTGRPLSEQGIDIHVYIVPLHLWRDHLRSAESQTVITEAISAGFIRVMPNAIVNSLRIDIENQLGFETVPRNFVFLKCVGRCFTVIKAKQEYSIKAKNFIPPQTFAPEIFLMELTADIRSILTSSQSNQSHLKEGKGHQKPNGHMITPQLRPNESQGTVPPHLNGSRLSFREKEEDDNEEEDEKEEDEERRPAQVRRQLTVTKYSAAETGDYILTPNSKYTQTMAENDAEEEEDAENRTRLKRREEEERRKEMLRRLALEQEREEQWKREEMARKEAEARREEDWRRRQEEELRKRLGEEQRSKLEEEERKWLEEVKQRQLEERKKQEEELRKRFEEEQRRRKEEETRRKQEEELRKRQEEELKAKLEGQQKRMTDEELKRKQAEELKRKLEEELRRKQEEELRRKQEEELRKKQEEELRRKQDEERRRRQEEEQKMKQDELNRKKEEDERKRMTAEQQKAAEKAALLKEIEQLREDRRMQELRKDELAKKVKSLQDGSQLNQNNARDGWRKRYLEEKKKTPALNSDCTQLKKDLDAINRKILSNVESTSHLINRGGNQKPSQESNLKIQAIRLRMEIEDLKSRLDNMNMKLTAELKLRTQAEEELQQLRRNQFSRKKVKPLTVAQVKQNPKGGRGRGGGATGGVGGKAVGSQGGLNSMQQLPPVV